MYIAMYFWIPLTQRIWEIRVDIDIERKKEVELYYLVRVFRENFISSKIFISYSNNINFSLAKYSLSFLHNILRCISIFSCYWSWVGIHCIFIKNVYKLLNMSERRSHLSLTLEMRPTYFIERKHNVANLSEQSQNAHVAKIKCDSKCLVQ